MKVFLIATLVAVAFASDVIELSDSDFASRTADQDLMLVEFFAPWCGHCKKLAPEYEIAATQLLDNDPPVPLAKVDCTANTEVCGKYGVSGYPTLKIFRNGEVAEDYSGPREANGIVKTMKSKAGPSSKTLESDADATKFFSSKEPGIVGFFKSDDSVLAKLFKKASDALSEQYRFAHTISEEIAAKYEQAADSIALFYPTNMHNKFEEKLVKFDGTETLQALKSFITKNAFGLCGHRTSGNADQFDTKPLVVVYYDVDYVKNVKGTNYWRNRVMKVAKKMLDAGKAATFAVSSANEFSQEMEEMGVSFDGSTPVVAIKDKQDQKFPMTAEFNMDSFEAFLSDFFDGKLEPYLKSEPVPDNEGNAVKVAVAKNFNELVNDPERDVLIEFYAPWCGHCKSLEPKYKELAEKLSGEPSLTIAKMDATANDVPAPFQVRGFPTIYYSPKGNKSNPKKYEGGREVDDMLAYLAREASDELKGFDRNGKARKVDL